MILICVWKFFRVLLNVRSLEVWQVKIDEIRKLTIDDEEAYQTYVAKLSNDDNEFINPNLLNEDKGLSYSEILEKMESQEQPQENGWVAQTKYFAFVAGAIAGRISCRWGLTEELENFIGHIGYDVVRDFRGKGIAVELVRFALNEYKKRGFDRVLITASEKNFVSRRVIEKCGGVLEDIRENGEENVARYWIELSE
jgi:predicted acetyltransferase